MKLENELCFSSAACSNAALALAVRGPGPWLRSSKLELELAHTRHGPAEGRRRRTPEPRLPKLPSPSPLDHHPRRHDWIRRASPGAPLTQQPSTAVVLLCFPLRPCSALLPLFPLLLHTDSRCRPPSLDSPQVPGPSLTGVAGAPAPHAAKKPMPPEEHRLRCRGLRQSDPPE